MAGSLRIDRLKAQMAAQIELVAKLICEDKSALEAELELHKLEGQLAEEECKTRKH